MTAWHEDDAFWTTFADIMFHPDRYLDAEHEVDAILNFAQPPDGGSGLDLCCGPGRHATELARRGYAMTGVDRTKPFLVRARERAAEMEPPAKVEFVNDDMRHYLRPAAFDFVINMFTSFGYFDDADNLAVLRNIFESLKPQGTLIMEMAGKEVLARIWQSRTWQEAHDGALFLDERRLLGDWQWIENRWILIRPDGTRHQHIFSHRIYSAEELRGILESVGFQAIDFFGSLEGGPYDHTARRLVVRARKLI